MKSMPADVLEERRNELISQKNQIEADIRELNDTIHQLRGTRPITDRPQA